MTGGGRNPAFERSPRSVAKAAFGLLLGILVTMGLFRLLPTPLPRPSYVWLTLPLLSVLIISASVWFVVPRWRSWIVGLMAGSLLLYVFVGVLMSAF